jgi:predicted nucleic acid-binding Zn ribbon protein
MVEKAVNSGEILTCLKCGKDIDTVSNLIVSRAVVRMAGDLQTVRKVAVAFLVILILGIALGVLLWVTGK